MQETCLLGWATALAALVLSSSGHVWHSVGKGRLAEMLVERFEGIVESRCPPLPSLSLFLGQPIHLADLFDTVNRFA